VPVAGTSKEGGRHWRKKSYQSKLNGRRVTAGIRGAIERTNLRESQTPRANTHYCGEAIRKNKNGRWRLRTRGVVKRKRRVLEKEENREGKTTKAIDGGENED